MVKEATKITVHADKNDEICILCHECGHSRTVDASPFKHMALPIEVTCFQCGHTFSVSINFRKSYRKKTNLSGICTVIDPSGRKAPHDIDSVSAIAVEDLSRIGIGIRAKTPLKVFVGLRLEVKFRLDNAERSLVVKEVVVRRVVDDHIGAEFSPHVDGRDKELAFYLLP